MYKKIYNKIGLYLKNGSVLQRQLGFFVRRIFRLNDYLSRKNAAIGVEIIGGINIDEKHGFKILDGYESIEWTDAVIRKSRNAFDKIDFDKIEWADKKHLFTGVLEQKEIDENSVFIKFALQKSILSAVTRYFGFIPVLSYIGVWHSPGQSSAYTNSQLFHCDQADVRQVKIFIYCSDVTPDDGPVNLIDATSSEMLRKKLNYIWSDEKQCVPDQKISEHVAVSDWIPLTANAGAVVFADTSRCFHFGSRISEKSNHRLVAVFQYLSPYAFTLPWNYRDKLPFSKLDKKYFNEIEKQVLGVL